MRYSIFLVTLGLIGCGGGGGGGGSTSTPTLAAQDANTTEDTTTNEQDEALAAVSGTLMTDLAVPSDVNYDPTQTYTVSIDISNYSTARAFASIYRHYETLSDGSYSAGYESTIGSVSLVQGVGVLDVVSAEYQDNLLVEIWFYDGNQPLQQLVSVNNPDFAY